MYVEAFLYLVLPAFLVVLEQVEHNLLRFYRLTP